MATNLPPFPPFDITQDQGAPRLRWKKYITRFRNLLVAKQCPRQEATEGFASPLRRRRCQ